MRRIGTASGWAPPAHRNAKVFLCAVYLYRLTFYTPYKKDCLTEYTHV